MPLTQRSTTYNQEANEFPTTQFLLLALVRLAEPIALTSIFPYAWKLVLAFEFGDESNASLYAGILISAFALAESLTGMFWGALSDRIGRKPVLIMGCAGTMLSLLIVGLSTSFWIALLGRFLGGALNGNIGVIQTMVGELVTDPKQEPTAYSIMPFVWSVGTIIGPCIGGYFAQPAKNFPKYFAKDSIFDHFPYLLPNLICAGLMLASIVAGWLLLQETHAEKRGDRQDLEWRTTLPSETDSLIETSSLSAAVHATSEGYGTFHGGDRPSNRQAEKQQKESVPSTVFTRKAVLLTVALGIFTYHSMTYDHLLPIFLQDRRAITASSHDAVRMFFKSMDGGLGLTTQQTGLVMSVNGLMALFIQAVVFPFMASYLGIWEALVLVTVAHPLAYAVVPFLAVLPQNWLFLGIYASLFLRSLLSIVAYPLLLMLLKEASPSPKCLGRINGLAASVGAACRTIASPLSGYLYGIGMTIHFTGVAWWASALVAIIGAIQLLLIDHQNTPPLYQGEMVSSNDLNKHGMLVVIEEVDSGYSSSEERSPLLDH